MNVLVLNAGSSSLKFQVIATDPEAIEKDADRRLARGVVERVGGLALVTLQPEGGERVHREVVLRDHRAAIEHVLSWVASDASGIDTIRSIADIEAVGHRVVHGGQRFRSSVRVDADVIAAIEDQFELAPLHNPGNLRG